VDILHDYCADCGAFLFARNVWRMRVSLHAISRYRERIEHGETDEQISNKIRAMLVNARPVQLRSKAERVRKLLSHGVETSYLQSGECVFVIAKGLLVSVYLYDRQRWETIKGNTL
jgi:hypothetical protein